MIKTAITLLIFIFMAESSLSQAPDTKPVNRLEKYYIQALSGSVKGIIEQLDLIKDDTLNTDELILKKKYNSRFKLKDEKYVYRSANEFLNGLIDIYLSYWHAILMKTVLEIEAEEILRSNLMKYLDFNSDGDVFEYAKKLMNEKGYNTANGKTAGIYDLLIWAKEDTVNYDTELPDGNTNLTVKFMDDIISMGWEEYATFGKYYPGGWATENSLYCVKTAYDTSNENFLISYLKHEGQHFADYKLYPKLSGADLEYRAKLVELSYTTESIHKLISFFIRNSGTDRNNSHSFANYHVIKALSEELFAQDSMVVNAEEWKKFNYTEINMASKKLFMQNSEALRKQGSDVTEFIK